MVRRFSSTLFWFSGVFCESLPTIILKELLPALKGTEKYTKLASLRSLSADLTIGKISVDRFCDQAAEICGKQLSAEYLEDHILKQVKVEPQLLDIFRQIPAKYDARLIVDIPEAWFQILSVRWNSSSIFTSERVIYTERLKLTNYLPDIFYFIPNRIGRTVPECIMIDPVQSRAVAAHKSGLVTLYYVYPRRLKIDLALQGIWHTEEDIVHPGASTRAVI